jgi:two-component system sensor histidine kinase KdpD
MFGFLLWAVAWTCFQFKTNRSTASALEILAVLGIATLGDSALALLSSLVASLAFSYYFVDQINSFAITTPQGAVTLATMALTALTGSQLAIRAQRRADEAIRRRLEMERLHALGTALLGANTLAEAAEKVARGVFELFGVAGVRLRLDAMPGPFVAGSVSALPASLVPLVPGSNMSTLEVFGPQPSEEVRNALASMISHVLDRARNSEERARMETAQKGEELRSTVLNALAHNFRTPLTSIKMAASMLRSEGQIPDANQKDLIAAIDEEANRLDQLIGESLDLARIEGRRANPRTEECAVPRIIERVTNRMSRYFGRREIVIEIPDELPSITGDPFLLEQMLIQVVDNAWKYSRPGSRIRITAQVSGSSILLSVRNEGSEIPADERARIFDKFYRGSKYRATIEGTGLGLAIAKTIAEAYDGRIWLDAEPQGPAFHFALPFGAEGK